MSTKHRELEIDQDVPFHRVEWRLQRIGWVAMGAIIVAALSGFLGHGPFSQGTAATPDRSLRIQFWRYERHQSRTRLVMQFVPAVASEDVRIWIDRAYLNAFEIETVDPTPRNQVVERDRIGYEFDVRGTNSVREAILWLQPNRLGPITAHIQMDRGPQVQFRQFIFP